MTVTVDFTTGASGQSPTESQPSSAAGAADFPDGHPSSDAQTTIAVGEHNPPAPAILCLTPKLGASVLALTQDFPNGHRGLEAHSPTAVGDQEPPAPASSDSTARGGTPVLASNPWDNSNGLLLAFLADALDDIEDIRKATSNRLRQLTRTETEVDGGVRGFGLTLNHPPVAAAAAMLKAIKHDDTALKDLGYPPGIIKKYDAEGKPAGRGCACLECQAIKNLEAEMRAHPLGPWVKATVGVGEKQGARLLAVIGDPYWHTTYGRPREVSELWQYAGHGDPVRSKLRRGHRVEHSPAAKMRTYLIAVSCMKNLASPYRAVYDKRKTQTEGRLHATPCVRCGPSGHPAQPGSPWSAAHRHADALRITGKEILRDLWLESKRIHEQGQPA